MAKVRVGGSPAKPMPEDQEEDINGLGLTAASFAVSLDTGLKIALCPIQRGLCASNARALVINVAIAHDWTSTGPTSEAEMKLVKPGTTQSAPTFWKSLLGGLGLFIALHHHRFAVSSEKVFVRGPVAGLRFF